MRRYALTVLFMALLLLAWHWAASLDSVDDLTLASPGETVDALIDDWALLWDNAWTTITEVLAGLAIALVAGALLALVMHLWPPLHDAAYPVVLASQASRSWCWPRSSCCCSISGRAPRSPSSR